MEPVIRAKRKRKPAYGEVGIEGILDAALAIVRRAGIAGLSMRALADEINLSSMAPYYYFKDKDELLELLIERILAQVWLPHIRGGFEACWREHFRRTRTMFQNYPGLALLAATRFPHGKENRRLNRQIYDALRLHGVPQRWIPGSIFLLSAHFIAAIGWDSERAQVPQDQYEKYLQDSLSIIFDGIAVKCKSTLTADPSTETSTAETHITS
jgi:AcrR family transcriptional regulator